MDTTKKYLCTVCGQVVTPNEDGTCPICGAPFELLEPVEDER